MAEFNFDGYTGQLGPLTWRDIEVVAEVERELLADLAKAQARGTRGTRTTQREHGGGGVSTSKASRMSRDRKPRSLARPTLQRLLDAEARAGFLQTVSAAATEARSIRPRIVRVAKKGARPGTVTTT